MKPSIFIFSRACLSVQRSRPKRQIYVKHHDELCRKQKQDSNAVVRFTLEEEMIMQVSYYRRMFCYQYEVNKKISTSREQTLVWMIWLQFLVMYYFWSTFRYCRAEMFPSSCLYKDPSI